MIFNHLFKNLNHFLNKIILPKAKFLYRRFAPIEFQITRFSSIIHLTDSLIRYDESSAWILCVVQFLTANIVLFFNASVIGAWQ